MIAQQNLHPDHFFTAEQQERLGELMARWRAARDAGISLSADEQAELDAFVDAEIRATTERSTALINERR